MGMTRACLCCFSALMFLMLSSAAAIAEPVFEQLPDPRLFFGLSSPLDPDGRTPGRRTADDFALAADAVINRVDWWGRHWPASSGLDDFVFRFYANDIAGVPGAQLLETRGSVTSQPDANIATLNAYQAVLDAPFAAQGGQTYWLAIYNSGADAAWGWDNSKTGNNISVQTFVPPDAQWAVSPGTDVDLSFRLNVRPIAAIPLPPALLPGISMLTLAAMHVAWRSKARRRTFSRSTAR
jgi:hypothetical protein